MLCELHKCRWMISYSPFKGCTKARWIAIGDAKSYHDFVVSLLRPVLKNAFVLILSGDTVYTVQPSAKVMKGKNATSQRLCQAVCVITRSRCYSCTMAFHVLFWMTTYWLCLCCVECKAGTFSAVAGAKTCSSALPCAHCWHDLLNSLSLATVVYCTWTILKLDLSLVQLFLEQVDNNCNEWAQDCELL